MADATQGDFWRTRVGVGSALGAAILVAVVLMLGNLGGIGIWEPWESNEISVAQEYATRGAAPEVTNPKATSWNGAVPTHDTRPVDRPLLKTMLLSWSIGESKVDAAKIGSLERNARMPIALATLLLALVMLAWLFRRFGALPAAVSTIAFVSSPAIFLGAHNLASEMMFVITTSLAIIAFAELVLDARRKWLWGTLFGVGLALSVLDQRLLGLYLVLSVLSVFAAAEVTLAEVIRRRDGPSAPRRFGALELGGAAVSAVLVAGTVAWALGTKSAGDKAEIPLYAKQVVSIVVPALVVLGLFWFGRKSRPGRAFFSLPGLLGTSIGVATAVGLARMYTEANPILLDSGQVFGDIRVLGYMLANHVFEAGLLDSHLTFDVTVRQAGFSLFPWVALLPLGFVYVGQATATQDSQTGETAADFGSDRLFVRRLLLVWIVVGAVVMGAAAAWSHYFYPAYLPIAASIGLAMTDREYWARMRRHPLVPAVTGFVAITIVLMIGKDLERFPARFIETYLNLQQGFEFPEDFSWGALYKPLKYAICGVLAVYFFGLVSWFVLLVQGARNLPKALLAVRQKRWGDVWGPPSTEPAFIARMNEKDAVHAAGGPIGTFARLAETPSGFAPALAVFMAGVAAMFLFIFVPNVTNHLSQRGVFETYTSLAGPGESLWRYQVSSRDNSVYLTDVEMMKGATEFTELFDSPTRFFAVIPRAKLASINYDVRNRFKRNLYVLDARSSRLLLVSNQLKPGETDQSFVNDKIVEGEPEIDFPVAFTSKGEQKHATFDGQLEFLGYSLDRKAPAGRLVEYGWGDTMTIVYFFRVLKRVPSSQKIFLHVDYPGARINGDHTPNNGEFATNYWLPGDIVKDVHPLKIESYSTPGEYTLNMGFFLGSRRMKVEPREAHDGKDRITIGKIRVNGL